MTKADINSISSWSCVSRADRSEIVVDIAGDETPIAVVASSPKVDHAELAGLIVKVMNSRGKTRATVSELVAALQECLECGGKLDWSAEQEAEVAIKHAEAFSV